MRTSVIRISYHQIRLFQKKQILLVKGYFISEVENNRGFFQPFYRDILDSVGGVDMDQINFFLFNSFPYEKQCTKVVDLF